MYILEAENLSYCYEIGAPVLQQVSFQISPGETVGLIGANGAGKSTLLRLMVGLLEGYEGTLHVAGGSVEKKRYREIREKVGYVFQDSESQLFLSTVYEDVAFGPLNYGYPREEVEQRVMSALISVHMEECRDRQIYRLSGGQKKLAALATVLAMSPEVILLDEPSVALDPRNRRNLGKVLNEMSCTKVIASHDLEFLKDTCDRVLLLYQGRIQAQGTPREILGDAALLEENGL